MSNEAKRGRGRPQGTGLNDLPTLLAMAEKMVSNSSLKATTALHHIDPDIHPSAKRRIQAKWRLQGSQLLADERERMDDRRTVDPSVQTPEFKVGQADLFYGRMNGEYFPRHLPANKLALLAAAQKSFDHSIGVTTLGWSISDRIRAVSGMESSQARQALIQIYAEMRTNKTLESTLSSLRVPESPAMQTIREFQDSAVMRAARGLDNSLVTRVMRELDDSAVMRAARGLDSSLLTRAVCELQDSPTMRAAGGSPTGK